MDVPHQTRLFDSFGSWEMDRGLDNGGDSSPAPAWDRDIAKRALDDLFHFAERYRGSEEYLELLRFVSKFRFYSPFNAMLIHIQMPGARYVAPAHRWFRDYRRRIKPGARPLVILQPMGPVMFVFDVSQTEASKDSPPLPKRVLDPFAVKQGKIGREYERLVENGKRDGVRVSLVEIGSQMGGQISVSASIPRMTQRMQVGRERNGSPRYTEIPVRYEVVLNESTSRESRYAILVHELAHLYCGHLGTPNPKWWPDRRGLPIVVREFEAESVAYLVCSRFGVETSSGEYLAGYARKYKRIPPISLDCVMKAAGLIETMSRETLKPR